MSGRDGVPRHTVASNIARAIDPESVVKNLDEDVLKIQRYFDDIFKYLRDLKSNLEPSSSWYEWLEWLGFGPKSALAEWDGISKDYDTFVGKSRRLATTVAGQTKTFREEMIPLLNNQDIPLSDRKGRLGPFIKRMEKFETEAQGLSEGFSQIPRRIKGFHEFYVKRFEVDRKTIDSKVQELESRINELQREIENHQTEVQKALQKMLPETISAVASYPAGCGVLVVMGCILGPPQLGEVIRSSSDGVDVADLLTQLKTFCAKRELSRKEEECNLLKARSVKLKDLIPGYVGIHESRTADVCRRLNGIANVWAAVRNDAQILYEYMDRAREESTEKQFNQLVRNTKAMEPLYKILEDLLSIYAQKVADYE